MQFQLDEKEIKAARAPHELFLTNLIGNHILWFVSALGMAGTFWQPVVLVPVFSFSILFYTIWRAGRERDRMDERWFAACHWQLAAQRSRLLLLVLGLCTFVAVGGWVGYTFLGLSRVAVLAFSGGVGLLPTMVTVLVLIIMESEALHRASHGRLPPALVERFPPPERYCSEGAPQGVEAESGHQHAG